MALDGIFLRHLKKEIYECACGSKVDKIYQPSRDEIVIAFRGVKGARRLYMSAKADSPRVHFINDSIENPAVPPMLCMLLRKKLTGARLADVYQPDLERVLELEFDAINELGDSVKLFLIIEIMGRYSNIILVDESRCIIDSVFRVDGSMSSRRLVLPAIIYELPPKQDKLSILSASTDECVRALLSEPQQTFAKAVVNKLQGFSPAAARELVGEKLISDLSPDKIKEAIGTIRTIATDISGVPYVAAGNDGAPVDFSYIPLEQYSGAAQIKRIDSFSELLSFFYREKDAVYRRKNKAHDIINILNTARERISRKLSLRETELKKTEDREQLRLYGDLISANLYRLEKGAAFADVENYYDGNRTIRIKLDPSLTPARNAQKYYRDYKKAQKAEQMLTELIEKDKAELDYIDCVFESLSHTDTEAEIAEIRSELEEQGYIRTARKNKKPNKPLQPRCFISSDGFTILVGRNNKQNDTLTLRQARKNDIWFHAKNIPGSHVIVVTEDKTPPDTTLEQAAMLAAYYSKAGDSGLVAVDYTSVRYVRKPQGAKPGMVIYDNYSTVFVHPTLID